MRARASTRTDTRQSKREPDVIDVHVGKRLRLRRMLLNMTQEQLASVVGVAFQQIQKYERGANRVSASRLYDIARALAVDVSFFFEDLDDDAARSRPNAVLPDATEALVAAGPRHDRDPRSRTVSLQLLNAYWNLPDDTVRDRVLDLMESLRKGGERGGGERGGGERGGGCTPVS